MTLNKQDKAAHNYTSTLSSVKNNPSWSINIKAHTSTFEQTFCWKWKKKTRLRLQILCWFTLHGSHMYPVKYWIFEVPAIICKGISVVFYMNYVRRWSTLCSLFIWCFKRNPFGRIDGPLQFLISSPIL